MIKNTLFSLFELRKDTMEVVALIISGIAFFIAVIAFQRTGGIKDLRGRARAVSSRTQEAVSSLTQTVRDRAANIFEGLERIIRGKGENRNHQGNAANEIVRRRTARTPRRS